MENDRPRQHRSEETIARIYTALERLLAEVGSKGVTVRDICRESGAPVGSFYHHFQDKSDLMCCYAIRRYRAFLTRHPFVPRPSEAYVEALLAFAVDYSCFCAELGAEFIQTVYLSRSRSIVRAVEYEKRFLDVLDSADQAGFLRTDAAQLAADFALVHSGIIARWSLSDDFDLPEATERILRAYLEGNR